MGRPRSDDPRLLHVTVRLSERERKELDRKRGSMTVGEYLRGLFLAKP